MFAEVKCFPVGGGGGNGGRWSGGGGRPRRRRGRCHQESGRRGSRGVLLLLLLKMDDVLLVLLLGSAPVLLNYERIFVRVDVILLLRGANSTLVERDLWNFIVSPILQVS